MSMMCKISKFLYDDIFEVDLSLIIDALKVERLAKN